MRFGPWFWWSPWPRWPAAHTNAARAPRRLLPRTARPSWCRPGYTETGMASWYGHPYHGRAASDGEIYDMEKMTAAHRTLPFDTWVRVYDLDNNKTAEVRIIDRGPFVDGRVIDLSRAAARQLEMIGPGTARVRIVVIRAPENTPAASYAVQVGAFQNRENADRLRAEMEVASESRAWSPRPGDPLPGGSWSVRKAPRTMPTPWQRRSAKNQLRISPASSYD